MTQSFRRSRDPHLKNSAGFLHKRVLIDMQESYVVPNTSESEKRMYKSGRKSEWGFFFVSFLENVKML